MSSVLASVLTAHRVPLFANDVLTRRPFAPLVDSAWHRLAVDEQHQVQTEWCWDATSLSMHSYFDPDSTWTQCEFANAKMGRTDCCTRGDSTDCNQPNYPDQALTLLGNLVQTNSGSMSMADVRSQIDAGRPISVAVYWSSGGGHNPAIVGYRNDPTGDWLAIADPWYGPSDVRYDMFTTAYQSTGTWGVSYLTKSAPMRIGTAGTRPGGTASVITRDPRALDAFITDAGGTIQTAALFETGSPTSWQGWWPFNGGRAAAGAPVTGVSRSADKLDVFVVGTDGYVYTAAWEPDFTDWWHGWWRIGDVQVPQGSAVHAVSRSADKLDIFVTDVNGIVQTAAWEPGFTDGWHGWWPLNNGQAAPGAHVTAVSRSTDKLDVFVIGTDGRVWTAAWEPGFTDWWHGWWPIGTVQAPAGAAVHAVSRSADKLDIFVTDVNGNVQTAAWEPGFTDGWHGWWGLNGGRAAPGAPVTAVSRDTDKLDVFVVGTDGYVYTAAWEPDFTDWWHGWWRASQVPANAGTTVTAVSRDASSLDLVFSGSDGGVYHARWAQNIANGTWRG